MYYVLCTVLLVVLPFFIINNCNHSSSITRICTLYNTVHFTVITVMFAYSSIINAIINKIAHLALCVLLCAVAVLICCCVSLPSKSFPPCYPLTQSNQIKPMHQTIIDQSIAPSKDQAIQPSIHLQTNSIYLLLL